MLKADDFCDFQSVQLSTEKSLEKFKFIDGSQGDLKEIYSQIYDTLIESEEALVIIDDVSALNWMGNESNKLIKFFTNVNKLCLTVRYFASLCS